MSNRNFGIWPFHPPPQKDEVLSSWIMRLAYLHHIRPIQLLGILDRESVRKKIDIEPRKELVNKLSINTKVSIKEILRTTYSSYQFFGTGDYKKSSTFKMLIKHHTITTSINTTYYSYCPLCFREDIVPYFRMHWRFALVAFCSKHKCELIEKCNNCGSSIVIHNNDIVRKLENCYECGYDLREFTPRVADVPDSMYFNQGVYIDAIKNSEINACGYKNLESYEFLRFLKMIFKISMSKRIDKYLIENAGITNMESFKKYGYKKYFYLMNIKNRLEVLKIFDYVLFDWPNNYSNFCMKSCSVCYISAVRSKYNLRF